MNIFRVNEVKELIELMKENDVEELIVKNGKQSIEIRKKGAFVQTTSTPIITQSAPIQSVPAPSTTEPANKENVDSKKPDETENYHEIKAPLVGTFYRAPAPDKDPFVKVGDEVTPGQTLCIVEAMKNMNEIESDVKGIVKKICVENAQMVEFGQVLFKIELTD